MYRDLIELYYDTEQPLNSDINKIARRVLANTEEERDALTVVLEEYFVLQDDGWHNTRCDSEIAKYRGQIEQASKAGKASAAKRSNKSPTPVEQALDDRSTTVDVPLHQPEPEPEPEPITNTPIPPAKTPGAAERFERFWQAYPRKVGKDAAKRAFDKRKPDETLLADMLASITLQSQTEEWRKDGGQFIPHPATWLNQGRWQDELGDKAEPTGDWRKNPMFAGCI